MDSTRLVQIRKDFYLNVKKRVVSIIGPETKELKNYRDTYDKELNKLSWQALDKRHLFSRLKTAEIILVGDFHAQKQSTRAFLRIIRKIKDSFGSAFVIALECLRLKDQSAIDLYLTGQISEKDFLTKVAWKKNWGFPWENYRPLFKWAQQNKIKIYGINAGSEIKTLKERDQISAETLKKIRSQHKKTKIFTQYGDLHLASAHLPKALKRLMPSLDHCVIFQSPEVLYFKIMEEQKEVSTDVVRFDHHRWALNGLPPWIKWQDYLLYLESGFDKKIKVQDVDPTDIVASTVDFLAGSFGLDIDTSSLSVYAADDNSFFELIERCPYLLKNRIIENIQEGYSFYVPEIESICPQTGGQTNYKYETRILFCCFVEDSLISAIQMNNEVYEHLY